MLLLLDTHSVIVIDEIYTQIVDETGSREVVIAPVEVGATTNPQAAPVGFGNPISVHLSRSREPPQFSNKKKIGGSSIGNLRVGCG